MFRILYTWCSCVLLAMQGGCHCNDSRLHSKSSEKTISRVLEKKFVAPMDREDRLKAGFDLVSSITGHQVILESQESTDFLLYLEPRGCSFFWPRLSDGRLLIHFSEDGLYESFEKWTFVEDEHHFEPMRDSVTGLAVEGVFILDSNGDTKVFRSVFQKDIEMVKE